MTFSPSEVELFLEQLDLETALAAERFCSNREGGRQGSRTGLM